jgi:hypothetical protein
VFLSRNKNFKEILEFEKYVCHSNIVYAIAKKNRGMWAYGNYPIIKIMPLIRVHEELLIYAIGLKRTKKKESQWPPIDIVSNVFVLSLVASLPKVSVCFTAISYNSVCVG